jgi:hypothetical protein
MASSFLFKKGEKCSTREDKNVTATKAIESMTKGAQHTASPRISRAVKQQNVKKDAFCRWPFASLSTGGSRPDTWSNAYVQKCKA